jgi:hypothetical protein
VLPHADANTTAGKPWLDVQDRLLVAAAAEHTWLLL